MTASRAERQDAGSRSATLVLIAMTLANAMVLVDQTAVPLTLPSIATDLHVTTQSAQWVLNASLLPLAGVLVLGGRLGDLFGSKRVFVLGSIVFAGASAIAGFAPDFGVLLVFRVLQGIGGALMLPNTIAIVGAAFSRQDRGRALGTMGGAAAVAGALGPAIGGALTSALSWRAVLLINVPLAAITVFATLRSVRKDVGASGDKHIDFVGAGLLSISLVGIVFGLAQSQDWGWTSVGVIGPIVVAVAAGAAFVLVERRVRDPLMDFTLLARYPNYAGATISQAVAGMAEMGLGIIFPLLLILNLTMDPVIAGLALIPATLPMIIVAPLAGRWYDRVGGRVPLATGFALMAASGLALSLGVWQNAYPWILPGLVIYGIGLALVLTVNDPVSLDTVPRAVHGQASGVSATAEQFGGALGIALLYLVFHASYVTRLTDIVTNGPLKDLTPASGAQLKKLFIAAESTGLHPGSVAHGLEQYLLPARTASDFGYMTVFLTVTVLSVLALVIVMRLVRKPSATSPDD